MMIYTEVPYTSRIGQEEGDADAKASLEAEFLLIPCEKWLSG